MKLITRNTDYAMRALCFVAKQGGRSVSAAEMVAAIVIPRSFLRKILQTLSREGLLNSTKGQGGGFALAFSPKEIHLTDLIRIFQSTIQLNECVFKKKLCPNRGTCVLKKEIDSIEGDMLDRLRKITIASLIRSKDHPSPPKKGKCRAHCSSRH